MSAYKINLAPIQAPDRAREEYRQAEALAQLLGFDLTKTKIYVDQRALNSDYYFAQGHERGVFALQCSNWDGSLRGQLRKVISTSAKSVARTFEQASQAQDPYLSVDAQGLAKNIFSGIAHPHAGSFPQIAYADEELSIEDRCRAHIFDLPDRGRVCVDPETQTCHVSSERPITQRPLTEWLASQPEKLAAQFRYWLENRPCVRLLEANDSSAVAATEAFLTHGDTSVFVAESLRLSKPSVAMEGTRWPCNITEPHRDRQWDASSTLY